MSLCVELAAAQIGQGWLVFRVEGYSSLSKITALILGVEVVGHHGL